MASRFHSLIPVLALVFILTSALQFENGLALVLGLFAISAIFAVGLHAFSESVAFPAVARVREPRRRNF